MISAGVPVPLDLFYGQKIEKGWREGLHEQLDEWLNTLEEGMEGKEGKLDEIVGEIFKMRQELTGMIAESLVEKLHSQELEQTEMVCTKGCITGFLHIGFLKSKVVFSTINPLLRCNTL